MKTLILLMTLPFLSFTLKNTNPDNANVLEKFAFGSPKSALKTFLENEKGHSHQYNVNPAELSIQGVEFEYIHASFTHDKLSGITAVTKNSTRGYFLKYLKDNYGQPAKTSTTYEWEEKNVHIIYEPNKNGYDATITFLPVKTANS